MNSLTPINEYLNQPIKATKLNMDTVYGIEQIENELASIETTITKQIENPIRQIESKLNKIGDKIGRPIARKLKNIEDNLDYLTSEIGSQLQRDVNIALSKPEIQQLETITKGIVGPIQSTLDPIVSEPISSFPIAPTPIGVVPPIPPSIDTPVPPNLQMPFPIDVPLPIGFDPGIPPIDPFPPEPIGELPVQPPIRQQPPRQLQPIIQPILQCPPSSNPPIFQKVKCGDNEVDITINVPVPSVTVNVPPNQTTPPPTPDLIPDCRDRNDFIDLLSVCGLDKSEQELQAIGLDVNSLGKYETIQQVRKGVWDKFYIAI